MSFYNTKEYDLAVTIRCQGYGIHDGVRDSISSMPCGSSMTWLEISSIIINEIEKNASNWTRDEKTKRFNYVWGTLLSRWNEEVKPLFVEKDCVFVRTDQYPSFSD